MIRGWVESGKGFCRTENYIQDTHMIKEQNDTLFIETDLPREEVARMLSEVRLRGGWRHKIVFSNRLSTNQLETGKPWSDCPLNKIHRCVTPPRRAWGNWPHCAS